MRGRGLSRVYLILGIVVGVAGAVFARSRVAETSTMGRELGGEESPLTDTYVSSYEIVSAFPHDPAAFTQGLTFDSEGNLYESDGLYRHGRVRRVKARTGETIGQPTIMSPRHFAEGIAVRPAEHSTRLLQITWKEQVALEYTLPDLQLLSSTPLAEPREGWGLEISRDGAMLYVTDGGTYLYHLNATAPHERLAKLQVRRDRGWRSISARFT
jgi:glutamine cyclotransferase